MLPIATACGPVSASRSDPAAKFLVRVAGLVLPPAMLLCAPLAEGKTLHPDHALLNGEVAQHGDWLVGCDATGQCTMLGLPPPTARSGPDLLGAGLRISWSYSTGLAPVIELVPLAANQMPLFRLAPEAGAATYGSTEVQLAMADAERVLGFLAAGEPLAGYDASTGEVTVRFAEAGYGQAVRAVRAWQQRVASDPVLLSVHQPPMPLADGRILPANVELQRVPATELIVSGHPSIAAQQPCGGNPPQGIRRFRFATGAELWSYSCDGSDPADLTFWQLAATAEAAPQPLELPEPRDGAVRAGVVGLEGAVFDFDFGILRSYRFEPGHEDCGSFRAWGYTVLGWQLLERREMPACRGIAPDGWLRTHFLPSGSTQSHPAEAPLLDGRVERFGSWVAGCTPAGGCNALVSMGNLATSLGAVHLVLHFSRAGLVPTRGTILRDTMDAQDLSPDQLESLFADLVGSDGAGSTVLLQELAVPHTGFAAMLAAVAQWQAGPVPPSGSASVVSPLPASPLPVVADGAELERAFKQCPQGHPGDSLQAWRLLAGPSLYRIGCGTEGLNSPSIWYTAGLQGEPPLPLVLIDGEAVAEPYNAWFESAAGYLRTTHYFGGQYINSYEDCGIHRVFAATPQGFVLALRREMPLCGTGLHHEDWITTYRAVVFDGLAPD